MTAKLTASLRAAPATMPALAALALFVVWATSQAGYPLTHWAPGGLVVLALLGLAVWLVRLRPAGMPLPVKLALGALAAYTALSFLSILWAGERAVAWEGADRTLLYLLVFALFACWPQRGASAALALGAWVLAMAALALYTLLHVDSAGAAGLAALVPGGRLAYPTGYPNASAAQWLMAFWPALLLARSARLPWLLRGLLAAAAVLLAGVALLSQSRGSLYATPVMIVLVFALLPGRVRSFCLAVPVAAGVAALARPVLHVGDRLGAASQVVPARLHSATAAILLAALVVGLVVAGGAALERALSGAEAAEDPSGAPAEDLAGAPREGRYALSPRGRRLVHRSLSALALAALVAVLAGGLAAAGNPVTRLESAWHSFKGGYGEDKHSGPRLVSGLGSNRYDFYRVALDEFSSHPFVGIGADNFQAAYLEHGRSSETPHYPHSVELRTLAQTGLLGALIALFGLGGALLAGLRAARRADPLGQAVAAAALAGFGYWAVHGSFDWFWEFAGLGAPAFALLGLACALAPLRRRGGGGRHEAAVVSGPPAEPVGPRVGGMARARPRGRLGVRAGVAAGVLVSLAAAASLAAPWLSELEVQSAARVWTRSPASAYARLHDAARLDPLSDEADVLAGDIAVRYGELARASDEYALALERFPQDAYATLQEGALASAKGERARAVSLLERASRLNPREALVRETLAQARSGRRVSVQELDRAILLKAQQLA
jgi:tetratricopeptide (TPR) repeat protein